MRPEVPRDDDVLQIIPCTVLELTAYWLHRDGCPGRIISLPDYLREMKGIMVEHDDET